jgi:hypothetical protein
MSLLFQSIDWWQEAVICIKQTHPALPGGFCFGMPHWWVEYCKLPGTGSFFNDSLLQSQSSFASFSIFSNNSQAICATSVSVTQSVPALRDPDSFLPG